MRAQCRLLGGPRHLPIPSAMLSPLMHTPLQTAPSSSTNRTPAIDTAARADATQALLVGGGDDAVKQTDLTIAEQGCRPLTVPPEDVCWYVRVTIHLQGAPPSQAVCFGGPVERRSANGSTERLFLSLLERRDGESIGFRDSRTSRRALGRIADAPRGALSQPNSAVGDVPVWRVWISNGLVERNAYAPVVKHGTSGHEQKGYMGSSRSFARKPTLSQLRSRALKAVRLSGLW